MAEKSLQSLMHTLHCLCVRLHSTSPQTLQAVSTELCYTASTMHLVSRSCQAHLMGTASIHSLELGCCTKKPETAGFACAGAEAGGAVGGGPAAGGPDDATGGSEGCGMRCAVSGCKLTAALPGIPTAGSRMDCEALESAVMAEPAAGPLPLGNALSHDRTCHRSCNP